MRILRALRRALAKYPVKVVSALVPYDRREEILRYVTKDMNGIEIGPYTNPLVPRADGYKTVILDVFTATRLRDMASRDPAIKNHVSKIEDVDLIGPAQEIQNLVKEKFGDKKFDYVVSSHNLEHIPDPIRFLQGCRAILKEGGILSLAVPDHRCCFDFFLKTSSAPDWLEAYFQKRTKPTPKQIFLREYARAEMRLSNGMKLSSFPINSDVKTIFAFEDRIDGAVNLWRDLESSPDYEYIDAHCWMFTPESFQLICLDLQKLGLLPFIIESVRGPNGNEFNAHLRAANPVVVNFEERRLSLLRAIAAQ